MPIWKDETVEKKFEELEKLTQKTLKKLQIQRHERFQSSCAKPASKHIRKSPIPNGAKWFQEEWHRRAMYVEDDLFNHAFGPYVTNCINHKFKYVIEIAGNYHGQPKALVKDIRQGIYFKRKGYSVFFINDFDSQKLRQVIEKIKNIRNHFIPKEKKKYKSARFKFLNVS